MQWLTGPAAVAVIAAELYRSYGSFPFSPFPPVWALAAMLCLELFGKQDAFFAQVQETAARNVIMLLKELKGDNLDIADVVRTLQNPDTLSQYVDQLETLRGKTELTQYFRDELLGRLKDKYMQFAIGIRQQLADLMGNPLLRPVLTGRSTVNL